MLAGTAIFFYDCCAYNLQFLSRRACMGVTHILEKQRWQDTLEALEDIRMGRVVDGDKVHAWLENWGAKQERSIPLE
jgi:predicted transcriptional regulator